MVRFIWSASVHRGCVHWSGEMSSTSCVDEGVVAVLEVLLVNRCDSRTVIMNLRPVGGGIWARVGVDGSVRVDFVCC